MNLIFIREIEMPLTVRGFTVPDANGDFNIYINRDLSDAAKRKSIEHEKTHIRRNDFQKELSVKLIESSV